MDFWVTEDSGLAKGPELEEQCLKNKDEKFLIHVISIKGMEIIYFVSVTFQKPGDLKQKKEGVDLGGINFYYFPTIIVKHPLPSIKHILILLI